MLSLRRYGIIFLFILGCSQGPLNSDWSSTANSSNAATSVDTLNNAYSTQALHILQTNCSSCHGTTGGSGNVYGFNDITHMVSSGLIVPGNTSQSLIYNEISAGAMPPGSPLPATDAQILANWINGGGSISPTPSPSETPSPSPSPSLTPTPSPTVTPSPSPSPSGNPNATFTYIRTNILQVHCTSCHSSFSSYNGVMGIVTPGSPSGSTLFTRTNSGSMPKGGSKLSPAYLQDISDWITAGALNN